MLPSPLLLQVSCFQHLTTILEGHAVTLCFKLKVLSYSCRQVLTNGDTRHHALPSLLTRMIRAQYHSTARVTYFTGFQECCLPDSNYKLFLKSCHIAEVAAKRPC